jgi:CheY-like chemotaxis protein
MAGSLTVYSTPGAGSCFTFTLALPEVAPAKAPDVTEAASPGRSGKGRVLLVEDYPPNVLVTKTFLEMFGYKVDLAEDGASAVNMADSLRYAIILMDIQMPEMDGFEATRLIRLSGKPNAETPIIGMTAHALDGIREKCLAAGMNEYLSKPFAPADLESRLGQFTAQSL